MVSRGFTLVEYMVVILVMGILMSIALPNAREWIEGQRVRDTAAALHSSLVRARSEAISRGLATSVKPVVDGEWNKGWFIEDPDPLHNVNGVASRIEQNAAVPTLEITIGPPSGVRFNAMGRIAAEVNFKIATDGVSFARCVRIETSGRAKTTAIPKDGSCTT